MPAVSYSPVYTCRLVREGSIKTRPKISGTIKAQEIACQLLGDRPNEAVVVVMLDTKMQVIGSMVVTEGLLSSSLLHPREIFRPAIIHNAASIILAHNHPSGDLTPSAEDRDVCSRLKANGNLMGIPVTDFIIVNGDDESLSFADKGLL